MTELGSSVFALRVGYCTPRKSQTREWAGYSWELAGSFFGSQLCVRVGAVEEQAPVRRGRETA